MIREERAVVLIIKAGMQRPQLCTGFVASLEDHTGGDTEHHEVANSGIGLSPSLRGDGEVSNLLVRVMS